MKSILQTNKQCYVCGTTYDLHSHHCIHGLANRKLSEKYGLKVWLCGRHHDLSNDGVHSNAELDLAIKQEAQRKFEEVYPELNFRQIFGRNYL